MRTEDLKNTKIYLPYKEDRIKFQKKVFKLGVEWKAGEPKKVMGSEPFYYIDSNLKLTFDYSYQTHFFLKCRDKQIFLEDVLAIEELKEECEFKPFERVLARSLNGGKWIAGFFSHYNPSIPESPYVLTSWISASQCIPYNEDTAHLLGTSDKFKTK